MSDAYDAEVLSGRLAELAETPIAPTEKGFAELGPITPTELVARGVRSTDLTLPVMRLRDGALRSNVETMASWCAERGVELCPHGKTPMSPQLFARQLRAGAWGLTAATIGQVRTFVDFGARRVLLANQLVDPAGIRWLAGALAALPDLEVIGYVDTVAGVELLDRQLAAAGIDRRLPVLIEVGVVGQRTGARTADEARAVAEAATRTGTLTVIGASGFEGVLGHDRDEATMGVVAGFCRSIREVGLAVADVPVLSAGGSTFFDVVARELSGPESATVVIRSGGSITHDDGLYATATPLPDTGSAGLHAAIDVLAYTLSRPEPTRALLGAGRRDLPFDVRLPLVRDVAGATVVALNDQHAFLDVPEETPLAPGDRVTLGIAHPCTAFDKWRVIPIVDDDDLIVEIAHTFF